MEGKVYIIMGVAGVGKSTIGHLLAQHLQLPFYDADDFHPQENIKKMSQGKALNDQDRAPWLYKLASALKLWSDRGGAVLACSALKEAYRQILASNIEKESVCWVYLKLDRDTLARRLKEREGHFFNPSLLGSQFADLQEPQYGVRIDVTNPPNLILEHLLKAFNQKTSYKDD